MILRSDDDVNDMIVDAEFGDLKDDALKKDICMLDTSVWPALVRSDGQNLDLAKVLLPDEFFDYKSAVIPIPTTIADRVNWAVAIIHGHKRLFEDGVTEVPRVYHIFRPTTPDSDDLPEISNIQERLQTFLSAVAQAQNSQEYIAKGGALTLNIPAETHLHSSGLQVIEFVENFLKNSKKFLNDENARPKLQPRAKRTWIEAKYKTAGEDLYNLLRPEVIVPRELVHWRLGCLATKRVYFVNPQCYTDLHNNGNEMDFELARRWIPDDQSLYDKFVAFPVLEVNNGEPQWLLAVIREPARLRSRRKIKDLIIGIDSKDLKWHNVYYQLLSFWVDLMGIPFPTWARIGKKKAEATVEGYSGERDVPKQQKPLHSPYLLLRNAAKLAEDPERFLKVTGANQRTADDIVPEEIMTEWRRDLDQIMGANMKLINGLSGTDACSSINRLVSKRAGSVPPHSAHNGTTTTRKRAASVDTWPSKRRKKLPDNAERPSAADVQLQLEYMENSFPIDEDSKLFKEYHIKKIKERKSVIVSVSPGEESNGEFDDFVKEFMPPNSATQSASGNLSSCLSCRYYDDQNMRSCDSGTSLDSLCTQSKLKDRPTIFEHVEKLSPQDSEGVQGGVMWFAVPVHNSDPLWRHALAELKRQMEELKTVEKRKRSMKGPMKMGVMTIER